MSTAPKSAPSGTRQNRTVALVAGSVLVILAIAGVIWMITKVVPGSGSTARVIEEGVPTSWRVYFRGNSISGNTELAYFDTTSAATANRYNFQYRDTSFVRPEWIEMISLGNNAAMSPALRTALGITPEQLTAMNRHRRAVGIAMTPQERDELAKLLSAALEERRKDPTAEPTKFLRRLEAIAAARKDDTTKAIQQRADGIAGALKPAQLQAYRALPRQPDGTPTVVARDPLYGVIPRATTSPASRPARQTRPATGATVPTTMPVAPDPVPVPAVPQTLPATRAE